MSILSDEAILSAIDLGELEIDPFNSDNLTPNGYDLTISEVEIPNDSKIDKGEMIVPPELDSLFQPRRESHVGLIFVLNYG